MSVSFNNIVLGDRYNRPQLAEIWGYKTHQAISRGIITPKDAPYIVLFVTNIKQTGYVQYSNEIRDELLYTEGETNHISDKRIIESSEKQIEIHLFYRERHHTEFTYYGRVHLVSYELKSDEPSRFVYAISEFSKSAFNSILTELSTHGSAHEDYTPDAEGRKRLAVHYTYERSIKNRAKAIEIHGTICAACGFDFNKKYGSEWASSYIEIHHTKSITTLNDTKIDPHTDLIPLCSNCHSMAHRNRGSILGLEELKSLIIRYGDNTLK